MDLWPSGAGKTVLEGNSGVYWEGRSELVARRSVLTGAALALVIALTGCKPDGVEVSSADVEGTWAATGPQGQVAKLVFLADGTYSGTNLPNGVFHPDPTDPLHGPPDWASEDAISGSWKTGWDARVKIAYITISIEGRSSSTPIEVEEGPKGRRLVRYLGDPDGDRKVWFTKDGGLDLTARAHTP